MSDEHLIEEKINNTFASRKEYDNARYISRKEYEIDLRRAINRFRYVFITGESGSGKTWLVDYYIYNYGIEKRYINLAEVGVAGSFIDYLKKSIPEEPVGRTNRISGGVDAKFLSGSGEVETNYEFNNDYLWEFIESSRDCVIVLDNFETIIGNARILNEISCLITLADDPRMIKYNPHFLIIGALRDIVEYFQTMPNYQTIANRIRTINIKGFTDTETLDFVSKGFYDSGFCVTKSAELANRIYTLTGGFPQAVNELCYDVAIVHYDNNKNEIEIPSELEYKAELKWLEESMLAEYSVVNSYFMENVCKDDLLNYILYSLCEFKMREFSVSEIKAQAEMLMTDEKKQISNVKAKKFLDRLSDDTDNRNILIKTNADGYRVKSYKTMACISIILYIDDINQVRCTDDIDLIG